MTINMSTNMNALASAVDYGNLSFSTTSSSAAKATEVNEEDKSKETSKRRISSQYSDSVEISEEGLKAQQEEKPQGAPPAGNPTSGSGGSSSSDDELTDEEALYDTDGDGELSISEQAEYMKAQANKKALESLSNSDEDSESKVNTADSAKESELAMLKESMPQSSLPKNTDEDVFEEELAEEEAHTGERTMATEKQIPSNITQALAAYSQFK